MIFNEFVRMRFSVLLTLTAVHAVEKCSADQGDGRCYSPAVCSKDGRTFTTWAPIPLFQPKCSATEDSTELSNTLIWLKKQIQATESKLTQLSSDMEQKMNVTLSRIEEFSSTFNLELSQLNQTIEMMKEAYTGAPYCSLGVAEGGSIPSTSLTASSEYDDNHGPKYGRLNAQRRGSTKGAWSTQKNAVGQWIQVDFGTVKNISGVMTQGRPNEYQQWVTSYKIKCGDSVEELKYLTNSGGEEIVFNGNSDRSTISLNIFESSRTCRYVRIYPQTYNDYMSLRMDWLTICD